MKNDTFDDVRYFLLGLQIANTADIFVDNSQQTQSTNQATQPPNNNNTGGDSSE